MSTNDKTTGRIEEERAKRRRRSEVGDGRMRNLAIEGDLDPRYQYRWINDDPGRVYALTERDDYDVVTSDMLGARHDKDRGVGSGVERIGDRSTGKRTILVRKLKDYYAADKAKEQARLDETDAALRRGDPGGQEGLRGDRAYVPKGGIHIEDGRKG